MDPNISALAANVVAILVPYLSEAGKEFAKESGKAAAGKIDELYQGLKKRFAKKPAARKALSKLKAAPESKAAQEDLLQQLGENLAADPDFQSSLKKMLAEIQRETKAATFHTEVQGDNMGQIINTERIDSLVINPASKRK